MLFTKATGVYGLMALLTGFSLSALQLAFYIYSIVALGFLLWLLQQVRKQDFMSCIALAWLYGIDTILHTLFTTEFAASWYLATSSGESPLTQIENSTSLGIAIILTSLRFYCSVVVASYARQVLGRCGEGDEYPFNKGTDSGEGWKGRVGRLLIAVGRDYWLGLDEDEYSEDWRKSMGYKYISGSAGSGAAEPDAHVHTVIDRIDSSSALTEPSPTTCLQ